MKISSGRTIWEALHQQAKDVVSPILISYVEWLLEEAQKRNITTLYFLARDGYILLQIAQKICVQRAYRIQCRYLYCSRTALRMPTLHLIGDEAYDFLLCQSAHTTLDIFFKRAGFSEEQRSSVIDEVGIPVEQINTELRGNGLLEYRKKLEASETFTKCFTDNSKAAYDKVIQYFKQEKLFEQPLVAIVDSGWAGTSQRSLRQLLEAAGYHGKVLGFYFGLTKDSFDPADGEFLAWYFTKRRHLLNRVLFNLNIFECLLSAPDGMTGGYREQSNEMVPVFVGSPLGNDRKWIDAKNNGILAGVEEYLSHKKQMDGKAAVWKFRRLMVFPTKEEAQTLGAITFCDDSSACYRMPLVDEEQLAYVKECTLWYRIKRKLTHSKEPQHFISFWEHGTIALVPQSTKRVWYHINVLMADVLLSLIR